MLHVYGGDALFPTLQRAGVPGRFLAYREVLCQGPTPRVTAPADWYPIRAEFLTRGFGGIQETSPGVALETQDRELRAALEREEVVLWFGPELFCQAILFHLLARIAAGAPPKLVSLVSVDRYPGVDDRRGCTIGYLSEAQLLDLFQRRPAVTRDQLGLARQIWSAWTAPSPTALLTLRQQDISALPFSGAAIARQLEEYPDAINGLPRSAILVLSALTRGETGWSELFEAAQQEEERRWITDLILWDLLRDLAQESWPAIKIMGPARSLPRPGQDGLDEQLNSSRFRITAAGEALLEGKENWLRHHPIDRWVGGVHLTPQTLWTRDATTGAILSNTL